MLPRLVIEYSATYDSVLHAYQRKKYVYSSAKRRARRYINMLQKSWNKRSTSVLRTLSDVSGLRWHSRVIRCYIVNCRLFKFLGISAPLTITAIARCSSEHLLSLLLHELVHNLLIENMERIRWRAIYARYVKEDIYTQLHIPVYAILMLAIPRIFGKQAAIYLRRERWWERRPRSPMAQKYRRSWELVEQLGAENVIKEFIK